MLKCVVKRVAVAVVHAVRRAPGAPDANAGPAVGLVDPADLVAAAADELRVSPPWL